MELISVFGDAGGVSGGAAADVEVISVFGAAGGVSRGAEADVEVNSAFGSSWRYVWRRSSSRRRGGQCIWCC